MFKFKPMPIASEAIKMSYPESGSLKSRAVLMVSVGLLYEWMCRLAAPHLLTLVRAGFGRQCTVNDAALEVGVLLDLCAD